jgi:hypothetical protein
VTDVSTATESERNLLALYEALDPAFKDQVHRAHVLHRNILHDAAGYMWAVTPNVVFGAHREVAEFLAALLNHFREHIAIVQPIQAPNGDVIEVPVGDDKDIALAYYKAARERTRPAFVPARVRLPRIVRGDFIFSGTIAEAGDHDCESNQCGAICVRATNGEMLGLKPAEYDVIGWTPNSR